MNPENILGPKKLIQRKLEKVLVEYNKRSVRNTFYVEVYFYDEDYPEGRDRMEGLARRAKGNLDGAGKAIGGLADATFAFSSLENAEAFTGMLMRKAPRGVEIESVQILDKNFDVLEEK